MAIQVLMIEDDPDMAELIGDYLGRFSIEVTNYEDPYLGLSAMELKPWDLLLLDLSLPGMDGLEVLEKVRSRKELPVIISSARTDLSDKVTGLRMGADDYLPKPYQPEELYARILSVLRRYNKGNAPAPEEQPSPFDLDEPGKEIRFDGTSLELTGAEYEILSHLIRRKGCALSREELIANAPSIRVGSAKSLEILIGRIRSKLGETSKAPKHLKMIRGVGYKLVDR